MKILHLNTERTWRGGEQQTLYLLEALKKRNIFCHLVSQPGSLLAQRALAAGHEVFPVAMHGEIDPLACRRIRRLIKRFHYDIIHCHTSHAHSLGFFASMGLPICRLVTRRVDFSIFRRSFLKLSGIKYRRMADYYIAISDYIKEVMEKDGIDTDRIFVVHSGIDPQRLSADSGSHLIDEFDLQADEWVVINVAHLAGHKGQQYLVRAIPYVLKKIPRVRFFIVGAGELMAELRQLAASLGLGRELVFTGFRQDVGGFYKIADLFVMSSIQEGLGTAVLDALALGKPVVAANSGGLPEIIHDDRTGRLVAAADPMALARGIIELLENHELAGQLAQRGKKMVKENFSVEAMAKKNIAVYRRLLSRQQQ
jgi:glycosyltransferase involved in cell wall biosynthesis